MDTQYVEMTLQEAPKVSRNWFLTNNKVYYVHYAPLLSVQSHLPDDVFKEDIELDFKIKSKNKS